MARSRKLVGITPRSGSYFVTVRVAGHLYTATFPAATPIDEMQDWRRAQQQRYSTPEPSAGSFTAGIAAYLALPTSRALPTFKQRAAHLELWAQALGRTRDWRAITTPEIDTVLGEWLETLAPGTVRKRRTALQSFFGRMLGKTSRLANPVKASDNPKPPKAEARAIDYLTIERVFAGWPAARDTKKGLPPRVNLSRIRARVMAYTGIPPGLLMKVRASDLQWTAARVRIVPRRKGGGVEARTLPLTPDGLAAFRDFHAADAYGAFAVESLNRGFKRACARAGLDRTTVHLYDLRHSFLTEVYRATRDLATVARLGLHSAGSPITERYARGAFQEVDAEAVAAVGAGLTRQRQLALKPVATPAQKLAGKVSTSRKPRLVTDLRRRA